ncbi:MAG: lysostaphin resistance A-like protein [Flavobacteriales bacterium]
MTDGLPLWVQTVAGSIVLYALYWWLSSSAAVRKRFNSILGNEKSLLWHTLYQNLCGFVLMGMIPLLYLLIAGESLPAYGLNSAGLAVSFLWVAVLGCIIWGANFFLARRESNLKHYPQIRAKNWTVATLALAGAGWLIYLLGYEFLFRGWLFFSCLQAMDVWPAIFVNVLIYALAHLPKGMGETLGAIPFGILLCWLTYSSDNIWAAFGLHACMALSNLYLSFYYHPEMKLVKRK